MLKSHFRLLIFMTKGCRQPNVSFLRQKIEIHGKKPVGHQSGFLEQTCPRVAFYHGDSSSLITRFTARQSCENLLHLSSTNARSASREKQGQRSETLNQTNFTRAPNRV
jgi:hypothetical protein